jgi:hypothetical protein
MQPVFDERAERQRERERVKKILALATPELREHAITLALTTDLSVEQCASRLLAQVAQADTPGIQNGHSEQPTLWARALQEAARRRLARR